MAAAQGGDRDRDDEQHGGQVAQQEGDHLSDH
jgi:hypothetical protein